MKNSLILDIIIPQLMLLQQLRKKIRQTCDLENFTFRVSPDLQQALDTVKHNIVLKKLQSFS